MKNTEQKTTEVEIKQSQPVQECEMRDLTDYEVLSVAGGPECDVGSGG
ncbi:hypothetical protein [Undibacterium pigrum]|uniref:Uncharacterized protein n=1 Tax=Undibacterium pigrum TaxID=401470 RepID=A0A318J8A7_9BURK|nr:hypothetical protein [Undibacterium pigrum]PXX45329.1 hypothetical protein DFR42_102557 [Undibacterium pigrum]